MHFLKRRKLQPAIQVQTVDGRSIPFSLTFRNGEIHIDPNRMNRGTYFLTIQDGKEKESRLITID
ncbi:MAG: hypothetical protein OEQ53_01925 [Saprospiraceae bacterium]|nr:hypothetical protein [Saprospiraceae bacterium]